VSLCHEYHSPVLSIDLDLEGGPSAYITTFVASIRSLSREASKRSVNSFLVKIRTELVVSTDIMSRVHRNVLSLTHTSDLSSTPLLLMLCMCRYAVNRICCRACVQISVSVRETFFSLFNELCTELTIASFLSLQQLVRVSTFV